RTGMQVVLVGIDADREFLVVGGSLEHADTGRTGCRVNHVRALIDLVFGKLAAAHRVVPGSAGGAGHVLEDFDLVVGSLGALSVTTSELAEQRNVHAADKPDLAGLGSHAGQQTDEVRTFVLLVDDRADVRQFNDGIDDHELGVGEFGGNLFHGRGP